MGFIVKKYIFIKTIQLLRLFGYAVIQNGCQSLIDEKYEKAVGLLYVTHGCERQA